MVNTGSDIDDQRTYILKELYETEKTYLGVLELIGQDFCSALRDHVSPQDNELLFSLAQVSYRVDTSIFLSLFHLNWPDAISCS